MQKVLLVLFKIITKPLQKVGYFIFYYLVLRLYRLCLFGKKLISKIYLPAKNKIFYPLTHRYLIHIVVIIITLATVTANLRAQELKEENFGEKTLLASLIGQYQMDLTEETAVQNSSTITSYLGQDFTQQDLPQIHDIETDDLEQDIGSFTEGGAAIVKPTIAPSAKLPKARTKTESYTVQDGDNISLIAAKFGVTINTILWENNLSSYNLIRPGDTLDILPISGLTHKVVKNDTVEKLAKTYSTTAIKIRDWNNLAPDATLQIGQVLLIPEGQKPQPQYTYSRLTSWQSFVAPSDIVVSPSDKMLWPVPASHRITQYFTWLHYGLDIGAPTGNPVYAAEQGVVEQAGWGTGYGNQVLIDHGGGKKTRYAHFSKIYVTKGQAVNKGQAIGAIGCTGWCTGPHLHFEVIINGYKQNPLNYVR